LDVDGADTAFKHHQMIEFVPIFIRENFAKSQSPHFIGSGSHFLRFSPSWSAGNTVLPFPIHIEVQLIEDQLCIVGGDN
jgi:hypothetical protein